MTSSKRVTIALLCTSTAISWAQRDFQYDTNHSECIYFGAKHKVFAEAGLQREILRPASSFTPAGALTRQVTPQLGNALISTAKSANSSTPSGNTIDKYIFEALQSAGVASAEKTTDAEFLRRVSLDLTGRVATADQVVQFLNDKSPDKRAKLIDQLFESPLWVDKWTMFLGDLFKNNSRSTQVTRYPQGRDAFNKWIRDSLAADKPYDQIARELITSNGTNSWQTGQLNWLVGGRMTGGPVQDTWDQQTANVMETFLGIANGNCVLCHNGRGHLDSLNLWGKDATRMQMWQMSAFFTQTYLQSVRPDPAVAQSYWNVVLDPSKYKSAYPLNTTSGNRPNRSPVGDKKTITPQYVFSGKSPKPGDNYQEFLATEITTDPQFARAAVNYIWKEFFNLGIVEPVNQFDVARLDPDNPPPDPWQLQPSNARLLAALAQDFTASKFDLKALMREIVLSDTYQLSSRYDNSKWTPAMEPLFARHLVRRLWAEEIHDNIAATSGMTPTYNINDFGKTSWALQFPEPSGVPGGSTGRFLDSFLRGNRDDVQRSGEASVIQALNLMNDPFVTSRTHATKGSFLADNFSKSDDQLIDVLFLNVLSRHPTADERSSALTKLQSGNRITQAEDLLWSLYNKVDFIYNY